MSTRPTAPLDKALNVALRAHVGARFTADPGELVDNLRPSGTPATTAVAAVRASFRVVPSGVSTTAPLAPPCTCESTFRRRI